MVTRYIGASACRSDHAQQFERVLCFAYGSDVLRCTNASIALIESLLKWDRPPPLDAQARRDVKPVIYYPVESLPVPDMKRYWNARTGMELKARIVVPIQYIQVEFSQPRPATFR